MRVLIEPQYLPTLEYFSAIASTNEIILDVHSHFVKQSWRNRSIINTANGPLFLIIPVTNKGSRSPLHEVKILETGRWRVNHWRSIESAYRKAPYFEHYADELKSLLMANQTSLSQLNKDILSLFLTWLGWKKFIALTTKYQPNFEGNDLRNLITPKNVSPKSPFYPSKPYRQVFGNTFVTNLSLIDLIFCKGPESADFIEQSQRFDLGV